MEMMPGHKNLITDVPGLRVGNAENPTIKTGVTALVGDTPFTAGVCVMGGAPGTRETDLLAPDKTVQHVDALVLSGGSAFGLDAASGVADGLRAQGKGFDIGGQRVPIVPGAILFDLLNGGDKDWSDNPYKNLGSEALGNAAQSFNLGSVGAGRGATTANLKGGLGSASLILPNGLIIGALMAINAIGSATVGDGPHFWAAPFEVDHEFGGLGPAQHFPPPALPNAKLGPNTNTTIGIVATNADLTQAECTRLATAAHDGLARAIVPAHTPLDGDLIFAASTNARELTEPLADQMLLGHATATCVARAIARAVYSAASDENDISPSWRDRFG